MRRFACLLLLAAGAAGGEDDACKALARDTETLLDDLEAEVRSRREGGRGAEADTLAVEIEALRRRAASAGQPAKSTLPEIHVVRLDRRRGFRGMERTSVRVTAVGRPLILVLASEAPTWWDIETDAGVLLARVLRTGADQNVRGVRVRVETLDDPAIASGNPAALGAAAEAKLGARLATVLQAATWDDVVVGPGNPEWQAQHVHADALELYWRSTRARRAAQREELKGMRFFALYRWQDARALRASFGEWTPLGPLLAHQQHLPDVLAISTAAVRDAERDEIYLLRAGVLIRYGKGPPEVLRPPDTLPQVREPTALAIDTRRGRLLFATKHDHGYLYALDLKTREWSCLNDMDDVDALGMAYDAQRDAVLCIEYGEGGTLRLHRFSPEDGAHVHTVLLNVPPLPEPRPLVASCDEGRLTILYPPAEALAHRTGEDSRAFVVAPHSGEVLFATRVRPWEDFKTLVETDLERAWTDLLGDSDVVGHAMRLLAGQGDPAVPFLSKRLLPSTGPAEDLERYVRLLSDDDAFVRDSAQQQLVEAGPRAEEFLVNLDLAGLPPEARRRVAAVLKEVASPQRVERGLRAIRVLEWIETPAAEGVLRELVRKGDPRRAEAARAALQRLGGPQR